MSSWWSTCALCPRLCRTSCPVATGSAREAAVPTLIASAMLAYERGKMSREEAAEAVSLCTDCGACQRRCHIDRPLPQALRDARRRLLNAPPIEPLRTLEGEGDWVAIEADERPLAQALAKQLGQPVRRWRTGDRLGVGAVEHAVWERQAARLRSHVGDGRVVVADGGVAHALSASGIGFSWLHEVVRGLPLGDGSCRTDGDRPLACCGAAGPLPLHHPEEAERVGRMWLARADEWRVSDARCRDHLRRCGGEVQDPLDALLEMQREG